jgi:hypothetical protein
MQLIKSIWESMWQIKAAPEASKRRRQNTFRMLFSSIAEPLVLVFLNQNVGQKQCRRLKTLIARRRRRRWMQS